MFFIPWGDLSKGTGKTGDVTIMTCWFQWIISNDDGWKTMDNESQWRWPWTNELPSTHSWDMGFTRMGCHRDLDLWPPNSYQFIIDSLRIFPPNFKRNPSRLSWDITFTRMGRTDRKPENIMPAPTAVASTWKMSLSRLTSTGCTISSATDHRH